MTPYSIIDLGTKPLVEPMLIYQVKASDIHMRAVSQEIPQPSVTEISLKISYLKLNSNLPGASKLIPLTNITELHPWPMVHNFIQNEMSQTFVHIAKI